MKTFSEIVATTENLYPAIVSDPTRAIIYDWFQFREVCDDEKFATFFRRILERDYHQYYELLRIEPGISQYDYLVEEYNESKKASYSEGTGKDTASNSGTGSSTQTRTPDLTETTSASNSTQRSEDATTTDTGSHTKSGSDSRDTMNGEAGYNENLSKAAPASALLSGNFNPAVTVPDNYSTVTLTPDSDVVQELRAPGAMALATTENARKGHESGSNSETGSDSNSRVLDSDTTESTSGSGTRKNTGTETTTTSATNAGTGLKESEFSKENTDFAVNTGRHRAPALILDEARRFIQQTNAWEWLYKQLNVCFMGIYDI